MPTPINPEQRVLDAMIGKLTQATHGWNAIVPQFSLDFNGAAFNFFKSPVMPTQLEETTEFKYPFMTAWTDSSSNNRPEKSRAFAGEVTAHIGYHLEYAEEFAKFDMEADANLVCGALRYIFDVTRDVSYPNGVNWYGALDIQKLPLDTKAANWRRSIYATLQFKVFI